MADSLRRSLRNRPGLRTLLTAVSKAVREAGGKVYLAGGYPRDLMEGKEAGDADLLVTGLGLRRLGALLRSLPAREAGIRGVVSAGRHFPVHRIALERERGYVDVSAGRTVPAQAERGAVPRGVADPEAYADASRRDFTINSLLFPVSPGRAARDGKLLDFFGGADDLRRKRIRCVGDPEDRFREDPVRMLRAVRAKNERRGFSIDPATAREIRRLGPTLLPGLPMDRVSAELVRTLSADPAGSVERSAALSRFRSCSRTCSPTSRNLRRGKRCVASGSPRSEACRRCCPRWISCATRNGADTRWRKPRRFSRAPKIPGPLRPCIDR
ncbi:MAG: CCA tRNA nucleotidyltransferase [Deltaproteobacteria bacterium]|nr:CCA tRNA nucleotidyltransferase [Deltaproteobacteria bacterium]